MVKQDDIGTYDDRSNLASNCGQIFAKGPALTKEIITKVQTAGVVNERKFLCGHEFKSSQIWVLAGLLILFTFSSIASILLWGTSYFDVIVLKNLELINGTDAYSSFINPKADPYLKVFIFNYTNADEFVRGEVRKLNVEEVGPYVYKEHIQRINPEFGDDGTLTFQEMKTYKFMPELSKGMKQSDQVVVPNLPLLGTIAIVRDENLMKRLAAATVLGLSPKPFLRLPAEKFIWGYDDNLFTLVKSVMSFEKNLPFEQFGLLAPKNGLIPDKITVSTGRDDIGTVGTVVRFNGQQQMDHWSTTECNRIDGTLGSFFSPMTVREKQPISIYQKDICRKLPLYFTEEVKVFGNSFPAYRYTPETNVFGHPRDEPTNQCFCNLDTGICPPHGVINATPCAYGPAYLSFPHFLYGDPALREDISGLNPDETKHNTFLDVHPTFGYTMAGRTRLQFNMLVRTAYPFHQVDMFEDRTMLPVAWFDSGIEAEHLPSSIIDIFYRTTFMVPYIEQALKYGCLLMAAITFITMAILLKTRGKKVRTTRPMRTMPPFQRNISGLDALIE